MMDDSSKSVEIMQQMKEIMTSQSESMQDTQSIVSEVLGEIGRSMHSIEQIKGSTKRLESSRNEVVQAVDELSEIAEDNVNSTRTVSYTHLCIVKCDIHQINLYTGG